MIPVIRLDAMPSLGVLSRGSSIRDIDLDDDRSEYIRATFAQRGSDRYFGSNYDKYYRTFANTVTRFTDSARRADRAIRDSLSLFSEEDIIRPCITEATLRKLPPVMYKSILSMDPLDHLFREGRIQGWGELTYDDMRGENRRYRRLLKRNGSMMIDPEFDDPTKEDRLMWTWTTEDPDLTLQQIEDILATRKYVESILRQTALDPTDLDMVRS